MTAAAVIKQSDLKRYAAIAKSQDITIEIEHGETKIRFMPNIPDINRAPAIDDLTNAGGNSLSEWRARNESRSGGNPSSKKAAR